MEVKLGQSVTLQSGWNVGKVVFVIVNLVLRSVGMGLIASRLLGPVWNLRVRRAFSAGRALWDDCRNVTLGRINAVVMNPTLSPLCFIRDGKYARVEFLLCGL